MSTFLGSKLDIHTSEVKIHRMPSLNGIVVKVKEDGMGTFQP